MKRGKGNKSKAVALITTLILVSAVVLLVLSYFAVSRNEARISASHLSSTRADLAERAAFEDARNLLQALTKNDDYLVTSVLHESQNVEGKTRYAFITRMTSDEVTHTPLFAGGKRQAGGAPNLNEATTTSLAEGPVAAPVVSFQGESETGSIETYGLTHLDEEGAIEGENRFPETVIQEPDADSDKPYKMRFTYWIEDLEGFPNIDVVGGWTNHYQDHLLNDFIRPGYMSYDARTFPASDSPAGARIPLPDDGFGWQFPKSFRGQKFTDQVAPGLSPREIILQPWATSEMTLKEHPFYQVGNLSASRHWLAPGGSYIRSSAVRKVNRFILGLRPYHHVPMIPYGHDYVDEGRIRYNLNYYVANRLVSHDEEEGGLLQVIERNLPDFAEGRKGGFPDDYNYVANLAANAIDYADRDPHPSYWNNTVNVGDYQFRGVDSYCSINEFFVRFEYLGYQDAGTEWVIKFQATPYVEFWNTFNKTAVMKDIRLRFRFLPQIKFKANFDYHEVDGFETVLNEPSENPIDLSVPPNGYTVQNFGRVQWETRIPKDENSPIAFPIVQDIRGTDQPTIRAQYTLAVGAGADHSIDVTRSGRSIKENAMDFRQLRVGFFFKRYASVIKPGEHFMRMTTPTLAGKTYGFNNGFTSNLGDPFMQYYAWTTLEGATYSKKASPGYRNFDPDKGGRDYYKDETRVRDWPDGGYDGPVIPSAPNDDEMPDSIAPAPIEPDLAPWRISNEGRFYSVTELGNLHDPVMWVAGPAEGSDSVIQKQSNQLFEKHRDDYLVSLPSDATPDQAWGGGNTLRIGRPEHELFDEPGLRASQLLDLFQTGFTGTNLGSVNGGDEIYRFYDPRDHQPPPSAPNELEAEELPYSLLYPETLHAEGIFERRFGHININSAPTVFEIETLLRGPFASSPVVAVPKDPVKGPDNTRPVDSSGLENGLEEGAGDGIHQVALGLYRARPFYSPSHLARVLSQLMKEHDVLPKQANDAEMEETFARVFNTTSFSSRHFRIFTYGEVIQGDSEVVVGRSRRVYVVFLRPTHEEDGTVSDVRLQILSSRDL